MNAPHAKLHVLLVEDDERLAELTAEYLGTQGVIVCVVHDGDAGLAAARKTTFDAVLLDLMLPGKDGIEVCRALRSTSDVPIIMVTARSDEVDRVMGLEGGADDYIVKPFLSRELLARIRANVRRARGETGPRKSESIVAGRLELDPDTFEVRLDGTIIDVTTYEFSILRALAERPGHVLSRDALLERAKGTVDESFDRSIDVRISRIRQKLGDDPKRPRLLKTVRGAGYVLVAPRKGA